LGERIRPMRGWKKGEKRKGLKKEDFRKRASRGAAAAVSIEGEGGGKNLKDEKWK